jgi:hypothetical protein
MTHEHSKKLINFIFLKRWMFSFKAAGFSCTCNDVAWTFAILDQKKTLLYFFLQLLVIKTLDLDWIRIRIRIHLKCRIRIHSSAYRFSCTGS